ncbi:MAG: 50S ribosomal protein L36 [Acidobacteriia bacterium]|nr:50S ribosomal protein L36 [Terriglobia bacterium]
MKVRASVKKICDK